MKRVQNGKLVSGDKGIEALLIALNRESPNLNRLESLVSCLKVIEKGASGDRNERAKAVRALNDLNEVLSCYSVYPQARRDSKAWDVQWFWTEKRKGECGEMGLFIAAFDLAISQRIDRLRRCKHCAKWLYARVTGQAFCSTECKDRYHGSNEEDKARRAAWARNDYQSRKKAKGKAQKGA